MLFALSSPDPVVQQDWEGDQNLDLWNLQDQQSLADCTEPNPEAELALIWCQSEHAA